MAKDILNNPIQESSTENKTTESKKHRKKIPGIYQRGKCWQVDTFYKGFRLRERCATPEMAEQNLRKMKTLVDEGRWLDKKRESIETIGDLSKRYLKWCEDIRQKDLNTKKQRIGVIVAKIGKETPLVAVTRATIEGYQAERLSSLSRRNTPMKPATVNRELAAFKHMLTKAVEWGMLEKNAAKGVTLSKENNRRLRYLTPDEYQALLEACPASTIRQILIVAVNTGMRIGEVLKLRWEYVKLRECRIEITVQKNGEFSTVPLSAAVVEALSSIPRRVDSVYVFPGKDPDKPLYYPRRQFEKALAAAGLADVTFHTLRHTAASHMVMAGVDLATVQEIMRHKTIAMTLRYAHLSPANKKSAVDALQNALKGQTKKDVKTA
jgi:integrase